MLSLFPCVCVRSSCRFAPVRVACAPAHVEPQVLGVGLQSLRPRAIFSLFLMLATIKSCRVARGMRRRSALRSIHSRHSPGARLARRVASTITRLALSSGVTSTLGKSSTFSSLPGSAVAMSLDNAEDCSLVSKRTLASAGQEVWARFLGPFAIDFILHFPRVSHI